jgi:hypothetical protein
MVTRPEALRINYLSCDVYHAGRVSTHPYYESAALTVELWALHTLLSVFGFYHIGRDYGS